MAGKIFISYRRDDSRYQARMIYEAFLRGLPRENVFMDIDTIPLGVNFVKVLEGWVEQCEVLLVLIGTGWINSTDPKTRKRRVDNPKDFVRVEIRGALTRDIPVVPILLDGAELPDEAELPDDIKGLLNRNAEFVDFRTFDADVQRLIKKLGVGSSAKPAAASATVVETVGEQVVEPNAPDSAEGFNKSDLSDNQERRPLSREWTKRWFTPVVAATVLIAAALIGTLVSWSPGLLSGGKVAVTPKEVDSARQAAGAKTADAEKARQAAEAKAADAEAAGTAVVEAAPTTSPGPVGRSFMIGNTGTEAAPPTNPGPNVFVGGDLVGSGNTSSADECRQRCEENSACHVFSFRSFPFPSDRIGWVPIPDWVGHNCTLFSTAKTFSRISGYTSGWR